MAGAAASPAASGPAPAWAYQATWVGGPVVPPGQTLQGVVDLTPGAWFVANAVGDDRQGAHPVTVTAAAAAMPAASAPAADVTVQLQEYAFVGLQGSVPAGPHIWRFTNTGQQPHFLVLLKTPPAITMQQVMTLLMLPDNATPPPSLNLDLSQLDPNMPGVGVLSPGQTAWVLMDLQPGTYAALCMVPDARTGAPHALLGMIQVFTVGAGTATATPAA